MKALAVLALVFLAFAHAPIGLQAFEGNPGVTAAYDTLSYCGQGPDEGTAAHQPCHACRAGIADLPPPPCTSEPAYLGFATASYGAFEDVLVRGAVYRTADPRAPPALVL